MSVSGVESRTLYDKIWDAHLIDTTEGGSSLLYIDRHLLHEGHPQAFESLRGAGRSVRRPDSTLATMDHVVPTSSRKDFKSISSFVKHPGGRGHCLALEENAKQYDILHFGINDRRQGIVHIIGPEQGFTLPGTTLVCGDSHTSTHGAFGALAFGIGTSEVEHVLATQTLLQRKSKNMRITLDGTLADGVQAKDVILHIIGQIGAAGGTGCVIEYTGSVIRNMGMEARMSICNMSIEAGARAGMIAPDDTTFSYLRDRPLAPKYDLWDQAVAYWGTLRSDEDAKFDLEVAISAEDISPSVTWGTSPQDVVSITGCVPDPSSFSDPARGAMAARSLRYMGLTPGTRMEDIRVDKVFIGSCTNSRIEDLRSAATVVLAAGADARVADGVYAMIVPGSGLVKQHAEAEGLDVVFKRAGFDWREAGCSMCVGMNPDKLAPEERCASTSNRNFEGRQGPGGRTHLVSPATAAATALTGHLADARQFSGRNSGPQLPILPIERFIDPDANSPHEPNVTAVHESNTISSTPEPLSSDASRFSSKFTSCKGIAAPLYLDNVDTDTIIPARYLVTAKRTGLGVGLFAPLRKNQRTGESLDFVLDRPPYDHAKILVCAGHNFACGSSREHAVWSLKDFGIECIIARSFGDIFFNNAFQNGLLPIVLSESDCLALAEDAENQLEFEVDLEKEEIRRSNGEPSISFAIDPFRKNCLLNGLDDIALTLRKLAQIDEFEGKRKTIWPWLDLGMRSNTVVPARGTSRKNMDW